MRAARCTFEGTAAAIRLRGEGPAILTDREAFPSGRAAKVEFLGAQIGLVPPGVLESPRDLERQGTIRGWSARCVGAGDAYQREIDEHLDRAGVILLLVSADFMASDVAAGIRDAVEKLRARSR